VSWFVVKVACAEPFRVPEPIAVVPSMKLTVPAGVPAGDTPVTVAENFTDVPRLEGFAEDVTAVLLVPVPVIVKFPELVAVPSGVVTVIGPVLAPTGTTAWIEVDSTNILTSSTPICW
jgi:hypothetical protein